MKKFEQELKEKAHLNKIKNAKKTFSSSNKNTCRTNLAKHDQAQTLLSLYEKKTFDAIPAYRLLRTAGLQQYTRGFIERGYGVNLGSLSGLSDKDKNKLYEDLKILPGHTVKLDRLIDTISKHSYFENEEKLSTNFSGTENLEPENLSSSDVGQVPEDDVEDNLKIDVSKLKYLHEKPDKQFQKQLERVFDEYTPNSQASKTKPTQDSHSIKSKTVTKKPTINFSKLGVLDQREEEIEKKFQKAANEFTPSSVNKNKQKKTFNQKIMDKKETQLSSAVASKQYSKTKYVPPKEQTDFRKKNSTIQPGNIKSSTRISHIQQPSKVRNLVGHQNQGLKIIKKTPQTTDNRLSTSDIFSINLDFDKIKALNRSFDGCLMSSTIANIDIEELVSAFAGLVHSKVIAAPEPRHQPPPEPSHETAGLRDDRANETEEINDSIDDQVGNILRESYLHPLYSNQNPIDEDIPTDEQPNDQQQQEVHSEEEQQQYMRERPQNQFLEPGDPHNNMQQSSVSSFIGGQSYDFGLEESLHIFNEPSPTELDYFRPTVDSIANFIKNVVLTAKMEREIPIMAAQYMECFLKKTGIVLNSLNYRRILVTLLLLASKIWDDQSFESPSFSKTFPEYNTILLNEMEKQVLKALDYKLKLNKRQFAQIYFQMRKFARKNLRSCQNKKFDLNRIRQLQFGTKKDYRSNFQQKRRSF